MSNKISRRTFLKCTGLSAAALGAAAMLGGCKVSESGASVTVKVGDKINNWNNLAVQLASVFNLPAETDAEGYKYIAVLVTAANLSTNRTYAIGAQNIAEIDAAYPLTDETTKAANIVGYFHALSAATTDFSSVCDGQAVESGAYVSLYDSESKTFSDSPNLPPRSSGYIELVCMVPTNWQELTVTYTPTFVEDRTLTFTLKSSDIAQN